MAFSARYKKKRRAKAKKRLKASRAVNPTFSPGNTTDHTGLNKLERAEAAEKVKDAARKKHEASVERAGALVSAIDMLYDTTFHSISAHVKGGPSADLRRIWFLACSAVFGRFKDHGIVHVRGRTLNAEWDVTGKECNLNLSYTVTGVVGDSFAKIGTAALGDKWKPITGYELMMRGPDQLTVGANWTDITFNSSQAPIESPPGFVLDRAGNQTNTTPFRGENRRITNVLREALTLSPSGELEANVRSVRPDSDSSPANHTVHFLRDKPPAMIDNGRVITTGERRDKRVQGPKPSADGLVRGSMLEMIAAALTTPGYSVVPVISNQPYAQPLGSSGVSANAIAGGENLDSGPANIGVPDITGD